MITSKQRANIRKVANALDAEVQIGQNGITENLLKQINMALDSHELVKISILANSDVNAKAIINDLAKTLNAEPIQAIGNKIVLYRFSRKAKNHIEF